MKISHAGGTLHDMPSDMEALRGRHVIVVGAGILGACLALRLAQAGARVTVIEERHPGSGTTAASFAWINAFSKAPHSFHRLHVDALLAHERLQAEWDGDWLHPGGSLHWGQNSSPTEFAELTRAVDGMRRWGARIDELNADQLRRIEPELDVDKIGDQTVYHVTRGAFVFGMRLSGFAVRTAVERYGARYRQGKVRRLSARGDRVTGVVLEDGCEEAGDLVIVAAGAASGELAATVGANLPILKQPGAFVISAPSPAHLRTVVMAPDSSLRADGGGRIMIGSRELSDATLDKIRSVDAEAAVAAMEKARGWIPALRDVGIEAVRHGVRPVPGDGNPVVGADPRLGGLYHVAAHNAVTLAPILAELAIADMAGFAPETLASFRPDRFNVPEGVSTA